MTIEPPAGLLLVYECYNMCSLYISEAWDEGGRVYLGKVGWIHGDMHMVQGIK